MEHMAAGYVRPTGRLDVASALEPYAGPWDERFAAHLLRRAGFGGSPDDVARVARMRPHDAVESLIHPPDTSSLSAPDVMPYPAMFRRDAAKDLRRSAVESIVDLQNWWLNRMLSTPAPLQEKMTFILHGHFTTAAIEKGVWPNLIYEQNQLLRSYAFGNLHDLTLAISQDPAMLLYLDNAENNKSHPNENYARELMELFTLGLGNYSEEDVRQSARSFTGWSIDRRTGEFFDNPRTHDDGVKTFLYRSGNFSGADIVDIIYRQRACERFWASALLSAFVYNDPEPSLIDAYADVISRNRFELRPSLSVLLESKVFYSPRGYRGLVKSPVEFAVGAHKSLGLTEIMEGTPARLRSMGQTLFHPPNVAGWPGGQNWLTTQMLIARENYALRLVHSPGTDASPWLAAVPGDPQEAARKLIVTILQNDASNGAHAHLAGYLDGTASSSRIRNAAYLTMAMPAYQLG